MFDLKCIYNFLCGKAWYYFDWYTMDNQTNIPGSINSMAKRIWNNIFVKRLFKWELIIIVQFITIYFASPGKEFLEFSLTKFDFLISWDPEISILAKLYFEWSFIKVVLHISVDAKQTAIFLADSRHIIIVGIYWLSAKWFILCICILNLILPNQHYFYI